MEDPAEKRRLIRTGLTHQSPLLAHGYRWLFFDVEEVRDADLGLFFTGFLGKYRRDSEVEIAIAESRQISHTAMANVIVAKARFFLHVESGVIAFHPDMRHIQRRHFGDRFAALFERAFDNFFMQCEVLPIEQRLQLLREMRKFDVIRSVEIYLHPANPRTAPKWKRVHARLDRLGADSYTERYDAKLDPPVEGQPRSGGLNVSRDTEIRSKIVMADDGYGRAAVTGIQRGTQRTISTADNPVHEVAPDDDQPPPTVLDALRGQLIKIFRRFRR